MPDDPNSPNPMTRMTAFRTQVFNIYVIVQFQSLLSSLRLARSLSISLSTFGTPMELLDNLL